MQLIKRLLLSLILLTGIGFSYDQLTPQSYASSQGQTISLNLKGQIGGKYAITVKLTIPKYVNDTSPVSGTYWYGSGKNGVMKLRGYMNSDGLIIMNEYDPKGKLCGTWMVTLYSDRDSAYIEGEMENAKGHTYSVYASCRLRYK